MTPAQEAAFKELTPFPWLEKFLLHVDMGGPDDCWPWIGFLDSSGVGHFRPYHRDKIERSTRTAWKLWRGEVPAGALVVHTCPRNECVNPAHLKLGTHKDRRKPLKVNVACGGCGKPLLRSPNYANVESIKCAACALAARIKHQCVFDKKVRQQARRYRIILHTLGRKDSDFEEMLAEMKASPMSFPETPEGSVKLDMTFEKRAQKEEKAFNKRLMEAYGDGVDMEDLIERFGLTAEAIRARAERAGVPRPSGHIGSIRRAQRKTG